jgi:hypothetical protein
LSDFLASDVLMAPCLRACALRQSDPANFHVKFASGSSGQDQPLQSCGHREKQDSCEFCHMQTNILARLIALRRGIG